MNELKIVYSVLTFLLLSTSMNAQRLMENLDRGVAAVRTTDGKVFVSWRLLGTEPNNLAFNLYCTANGKTEKLNKTPIDKTTNFLDAHSDTTIPRTYFVKTIVKGKEGNASRSFILKPGNMPYFSIALQTPKGYASFLHF